MIGDLVASRRSSLRQQLQEQLKQALDDLNQDRTGLTSPYTITLGDEFQVVYEQADRVFADCLAIAAAVYPVRMRFSLSLGEISTELNPDQALGMDGPAFYQARDGIDQLKRSGELFRLAGLNDAEQPLATGGLGLFSHQLNKWNANRLHILNRLLQDWRVERIAEELNISEQAVYKNINSGGLHAVIRLLTALTQTLNESMRGRAC
ncbi:hypothetical protein BGP77_06095 [Saccharospirillum sp. MSK14-1]|nr:hypothetical protein BGP77_06095 [Saccharospirillum sp. MSK14-1]